MTATIHRKPSTEVHTTAGSPFAKEPAAMLDGGPIAANHTYGAASMQTYADGQVAYHTHESADGFLSYVNQFEQTSFRVKDGQVKWWQYSPSFDDWQDKYGCDSVEVFYHAGHGGTDASSGTYSAPLGGTWDGQSSLDSSQMTIGNQRLRYLFLATCEGCMVFAPNNPYRTWSVPNRGLRMVFGATANIWDDPGYGRNFWNHWRSGDSFSQAWQDALLDADGNQQPSTVACGATAQEAQNRLFNERFFTNASASSNWYWWRWVGNAPSLAAPNAQLQLPDKLYFAYVATPGTDQPDPRESLRLHGFPADLDLPLTAGPGLRIESDGRRIGFLAHGVVVENHAPLIQRSTLTEAQVAKRAHAAIPGATDDLQLIRVLPVLHAGASADDKEQVDAEIFEHIAVFRQTVAGLPVITPGVGEVRVHVDAEGKARRLVDTRLAIGPATEAGPAPQVIPTPIGHERAAHRHDLKVVLESLEQVSLAAHGRGRSRVHRMVPGSVEIGYALRGDVLVPVARAAIAFGTETQQMYEAVEVELAG